ncbi:MAG: TldD/PmbA family protein [Candidatus Obscuribacterales bacterium]
MINEKRARNLIQSVIEYAGGRADGVEVTIEGSDVATSRFANNEMTQNQAPSCDRLSVRLLSGRRQIRMSSDDTTRSGIRELVDNALAAVSFVAPDDEIEPLSEAEERGDDGSRFDGRVSRMSAVDRAEAIDRIIDQARAAALNSSGVVASGTLTHAIGNSRGLFEFHRETHAECSVTVTAEDSSGWAKMVSPHADRVDFESLGRTALSKATLSARPREIAPGSYTVILEPAAVLDLLGFLLWDFAGTSHLDRRSCLLDQVGEKVFGENVSIFDDAYHGEQAGAPFDGEGLRRMRVPIIEKGVLKGLVYGRKSARKAGAEATGHGLPVPSNMGDYPMNLVMEGGDHDLHDMIRSTDRGILLSRVWYVRDVDPARKILTGMTRDGTFMVENGELAGGIKNLRFNVSLKDLLNNVIMLGTSARAAGEETFPAVVPALKVEGFRFTETTRF